MPDVQLSYRRLSSSDDTKRAPADDQEHVIDVAAHAEYNGPDYFSKIDPDSLSVLLDLCSVSSLLSLRKVSRQFRKEVTPIHLQFFKLKHEISKQSRLLSQQWREFTEIKEVALLPSPWGNRNLWIPLDLGAYDRIKDKMNRLEATTYNILNNYSESTQDAIKRLFDEFQSKHAHFDEFRWRCIYVTILCSLLFMLVFPVLAFPFKKTPLKIVSLSLTIVSILTCCIVSYCACCKEQECELVRKGKKIIALHKKLVTLKEKAKRLKIDLDRKKQLPPDVDRKTSVDDSDSEPTDDPRAPLTARRPPGYGT